MFFLKFPLTNPVWFYSSALFLSFVLGVRGILIQIHSVGNENRKLKKEGLEEWSLMRRVLVHYFHDFIYNFIGSLIGWVAYFIISYRLFRYIGPNIPPPPQGFMLENPNLHLLGLTDFVLVVLLVLGITGKLPQTIEGFILSIGKAVENITQRISKD